MKTLVSIVGCLILVGCGSSSTTVVESLAETGGVSNGGAGGEPAATGGVSEGGSVTGGVATGGDESGGVSNGGAGGSTGGVENTGGTGVCTPKTCLTIAVELAGGVTDPVPEACGLVDDGCGNIIDCGGCEFPTECGLMKWNGIDDRLSEGHPNLCGRNCVRETKEHTDFYCKNFENTWLYSCSAESGWNTPALPECYAYDSLGGMYCCSE